MQSSSVFITFSGNCRKALRFYQNCFGGELTFKVFEKEVEGYPERPVVNGVLVADRITIHGSDLVHNEGRTVGNYISILLHCEDEKDRKRLIDKLSNNKINIQEHQELIEVVDIFSIRWMLTL